MMPFVLVKKYDYHGDLFFNKSNTGGMDRRDIQQLDFHTKLY